jgi:hypothetical protein
LSLLLGGSVLLAGSIAVRRSIPDEYIGAERAYLSDVEARLIEFDSIKENKRIVLIGSSPVILGLSAEQIETATGIPTRNLALDASRAVFADYAAMVIEHARPGDVFVIADPNLRKPPQMQLPLRCVREFGLDCIRGQNGLSPHIIQDSLVLFTDRSFGDEPVPRTAKGDLTYSKPQKTFPPAFQGPFPKNGADNMAKLAKDVRGRGACPIFVLTPLLPKPEQISLWQAEFDKLWHAIDEAGLHDVVVEDSPLWSDPVLFHHDEHPSERGREVWSASVIAKLREKGLPGTCGQLDARSN